MVTQGHHDVTCKDEKEVEEEEEELQQAKPLERVRKRKKKGRETNKYCCVLKTNIYILAFNQPPPCHTLPPSSGSTYAPCLERFTSEVSYTRHANLFHHFKNIHLYVCL